MSIGHGRGGPTDVGSVTRTSHLPSSSETVERPGQSRGGGGAEGAARAGAYDGITRNVKFHWDSYWAVSLQASNTLTYAWITNWSQTEHKLITIKHDHRSQN